MDENVGLIILAGFVIVSFTIRQIVKHRSHKKGRSREMLEDLLRLLVWLTFLTQLNILVWGSYYNRLRRENEEKMMIDKEVEDV